MTGKPINRNKEVIEVKNAVPYVRKLGFLVSNFKMALFFFMLIFSTLFVSAIETPDISTFQIDLESKTTILVLFFFFVGFLFLFSIGKYVFAGSLLIIVGFALMFSGFNLIFSFVIIMGGILTIFLN